MDAKKLVELGLTKREANAYLALIGLGEAKAGEIAKLSHEDRTNIYDSLSGLVKKGLASHVLKGKTTYYRAASPDKLRDYLAEKQEALEEFLPGLSKEYKSFSHKPTIETYEGKEGLKTVLSDVLKEGKSFVVFGATDKLMRILPDFTRRYLAERERKGIWTRQIHAKGEPVLPSPISRFKTVPQAFLGPATTMVYADKVALMLWFTEPPVAVLIKSKEAAKAYRNQFEFMWKMAK